MTKSKCNQKEANITFFPGGAHISRRMESEDAQHITPKQLFKLLATPPEQIEIPEGTAKNDEKANYKAHSPYFINGRLEGHKKQENIKGRISLVILDWDHGTPQTKKLKKALKGFRFAHVPSWTPGRARTIIEVKPYRKEATKEVTDRVVDYLKSKGIAEEPAPESGLLAQAWFCCSVRGEEGRNPKTVIKSGRLMSKKDLPEPQEPAQCNFDDDCSLTPSERFIDALATGTIHVVAKKYAAYLWGSTLWTAEKIYAHVVELVCRHCTDTGKVDRWREGEGKNLISWLEESCEIERPEGAGLVFGDILDGDEDAVWIDEVTDLWMINEILPTGLVSLYGPSGGMKTAVAMSLCHDIYHLPYIGHHEIKVKEGLRNYKQGRQAMYLAREGADGVKTRWKALCRIKNKYAPLIVPSIPAPCVGAGLVDLVRDELQANPDIGLIVVDTKSMFFAGEENSNTDTNAFIISLKKMIPAGGCVLVIGHTGLKGKHERGASAFFGGLDGVVLCDEGKLIPTKTKEGAGRFGFEFGWSSINCDLDADGKIHSSFAVSIGKIFDVDDLADGGTKKSPVTIWDKICAVMEVGQVFDVDELVKKLTQAYGDFENWEQKKNTIRSVLSRARTNQLVLKTKHGFVLPSGE